MGEPHSAFDAVAAAVQSGSASALRQLLNDHPAVRSHLNDGVESHFGATPLMLAVQRGRRDLVDLLLDAGADINARSHWWAGSFGVMDDDKGLAPHLIERGAIVTPHAAARLGMVDALREMIASDPSAVHARGGDGQMPLHFASTTEIADLLLANGADIDARDIDHESTAAQWMIKDRQSVAKHLIARGCSTDILMASAIGDIALVRKHLERDPACANMSVSERWFPKRDPRSGGTIYIWTLGWHMRAETIARKAGHHDIEAMMRELTKDDRDPVRFVAAGMSSDIKELRSLLERGWDVASADQQGVTALHWAAFHGSLAIAEQLIARGAPIDAKETQFNASPIGWCIHGSLNGWHRDRGDYGGVARALIAAGAALPPHADKAEASLPVQQVLREAIAARGQ